jgi:hypothetical protein
MIKERIMKSLSALSLAILGLSFVFPVFASHDSTHALTDEQWQQVEKNLELIDAVNYVPTLLPVIMRNQDALMLTSEQLAHFRDWRKHNYVNMVNTMNEIITTRVDIKRASLDASVSGEKLQSMLDHAHELQKKLMTIKLSCRKMLVDSFNDEQWENFAFVASDNPKLAAFFADYR